MKKTRRLLAGPSVLPKVSGSIKPADSNRIGLMAVALAPLLCLSQAHGAGILADANDGMLENRSEWTTGPVIHNTNDWNISIGEWYGTGLTTAVMPFQLPNLGAVSNPFLTATFGVNLYQKGGAAVTNLDLYAVRTNASPTIAATDWYNGSAVDPNATLIQAGFITPASTTVSAGPSSGPNNSTNTAGSAALLNNLNSAYAGGAGADQYVFLRLSYASGSYATGWDAYNITTRNAGFEGDAPVINYTIPEPSAVGLLALGSLGMLGYRSRRSGVRA